MKRDEVIKLTDEWLKSVPNIRKRIRLIDIALKKDIFDIEIINKIKKKRSQLNSKLVKIIKAIDTLEDDNQRIICYRYFEGLSYSKIALRIGLRSETISRRIKKLLLNVGRIMFGFEDEFWNEVFEE